MNKRTCNILLLILALPALAAPWVSFYETVDPPDTRQWAFIDFFELSSEDYSPTALERLDVILSSLPIFLPFLILYRQLRRRQLVTTSAPSGGHRIAVGVAFVWLAIFTFFSVVKLPDQIWMGWVFGGFLQSMRPTIDQILRMIGLFGSLSAGAWMLWHIARKHHVAPTLDVTECAALTVYLVAVVPELVTDAVNVFTPSSGDRLLFGYYVLLWTCAIYVVTLAVRLREG